MKRKLCAAAIAALISQSAFGVCDAQVVQVGPGYVKAPFVRVYRGPNGTVVDAPFTHVERGAPAYGPRYAPSRYPNGVNGEYRVDQYGVEQYIPAPGIDLTIAERHRRRLAIVARRLDHDLTRFSTGAQWQDFFRLPPEVRVIQRGADRPAVQPDVVLLQIVLSNFEAVAQDEHYRKISRMGSFRATHHHLKAYVAVLSDPNAHPGDFPSPEMTAPGVDQPSVLLPPATQPAPQPAAEQSTESPTEELPLPDLDIQP